MAGALAGSVGFCLLGDLLTFPIAAGCRTQTLCKDILTNCSNAGNITKGQGRVCNDAHPRFTTAHQGRNDNWSHRD